MDHLLKEERQQLILATLQENKKVTVHELSERFKASEITIRRDLRLLAESGKIQRAHRGALVVVPAPPEPPIIRRMGLEQHAKESIARAAVDLVKDGETIFIGSGSTTAYMARYLAACKRNTIVTNALNIATELASNEADLTVVLTGGVMRTFELSLLGHIAELTLPELRVDKVIMGAQALDFERGWTTDHLPEVSTTRKFIEMSPELIVLADHTKFGCAAAALIAPFERIHTIVTDSEISPQVVRRCETMGIRLVIAE